MTRNRFDELFLDLGSTAAHQVQLVRFRHASSPPSARMQPQLLADAALSAPTVTFR